MSLPDIYKQLRTLGARERELDKGMEKETGAIRADYRASVERLKTRDGIMKEGGRTRKRGQRCRALGNEGGRRFGSSPPGCVPSPETNAAGGGEQAREAMRERRKRSPDQCKVRPRIADNQRESKQPNVDPATKQGLRETGGFLRQEAGDPSPG